MLRASREIGSVRDSVQWFRSALQEIRAGGHDEYRVELRRAGRCLASLPADGSWYTVIGAAAERAPESAPAVDLAVSAPDRGSSWPSQPRFGYQLDFFAALTVNLRAEIIGPTPEGYRANFFVKDGYVSGPRIQAEVLPDGGDWMHVRPDGIGSAHIRITWRTRDGALILDQATGVFDLGPNGYAKIAAGDFTGSPPLHVAATWSTADPEWQWLNRCQGIGIGRVVMETLQVQCDIYLPRVGDRISHG